MDLYAENILDHYRNPHHYGHLAQPTVAFDDSNPLCGDKIHLELLIEEDVITDAAFSGEGCAISQASSSMLLDEVIGKSMEELLAMSKEDIFEMVGVPLSTSRVKCALLGFAAMKKMLKVRGLNRINNDVG